MNEFLYLSNLDNRNINLQIIKSFSLLILNVSSPQTIYYIFSNNFINQILTNDFEKYDEEFVSHYVNFLKSLTCKLDTTIIQFFFHKHYNSFPLCAAALKLYNYPDSMIKNTVRNIVLALLKLKYDPIIEYFCTLPAISYFPFLSLSIRDLILKLNEEIMSDDPAFVGLHSVQDDIIIDILYFQDIFSLGIVKISNLLTNSLFYYTILPLLCGSLISVSRPKIAISTSLYVLTLLFDYIQDESFLNSLYSTLFLNKISKRIHTYTNEYPSNCRNYYSDFKEQIKSSIPSYFDYICLNFSEPFINFLVNCSSYQGMTNEEMSDYKEVNNIKKKIKKTFKDNFDINNSEHYQKVLEEVLKNMSKKELEQMINYHKVLSSATGINVGLFSEDYRKNSFMFVIHKMFYKIKAEQEYLANLNDVMEDLEGGKLKILNLMNNDVKLNIMSYLRSKDDSLIVLVSLLIYISHNKKISNELQCVCGLAKADFHKNSNYDTSGVLSEIYNFDSDDKSPNKTVIEENKYSENNSNNYTLFNLEGKNDYEILGLNNISMDNYIKNEENGIGLNDDNLTKKNTYNINELNDINYINTNVLTNNTINKNKKNKTDAMSLYEKAPKDNLNFTNAFISKELRHAEQTSYDHQLVDSYLELLKIEPAFRIITNKLILVNLSTLILKSNNFSYIQRKHVNSINDLYYYILSTMKEYIKNKKVIRDVAYEIFETEWINYKKDFTPQVKKIIETPFLLLPFNLEDTIEDFPNVLKMQKSDSDNFKSLLLTFMYLHDIRCGIYRNPYSLSKKFPIKMGDEELILGRKYLLESKYYYNRFKLGIHYM